MPNDSPLYPGGTNSSIGAIALHGLSQTPKTLPAKLFYDEEGCRLFYRITELPEYYLTRTELTLLGSIAAQVAALAPAPSALIEYGASDETKAGLLLDQENACGALAFAAYVPIDVAAQAINRIAHRLQQSRPGLTVAGIVADFMHPVALPKAIHGLARLGFFPGSTIGNLEPPEARRFLHDARAMLGRDSRLLVGIDLRKDPEILIPAYDDAEGVTAAFNLNLLARLNREARATFDLSTFAHRVLWNRTKSRIEMHLVSRREQLVHVEGHTVRFRHGETIHTESSYKYTSECFLAIARSAGWRAERAWTDPGNLISLHLLMA
ncbi:MAG: L-histidine N(alpha)-methyltransferase [Pseudomonadota bacterium]|nr:L-histidine N(alpha)-methyltransferase [Pseudomonadota bacterium]